LSLTWRSRPLHALIVDALKRRGGTAKDKDLFEAIRAEHDVSYAEFLKALMTLELRGVVSVSTMREDLRKVSLLRDLEA
jgi:hypothetical protein